MALRALIEDGSTRIREMTLAEHNAMLSRITYLYQQGTVPVELSVVSSGGNITPNMTDTRYKSGTAAQNTSSPWPVVTTYPTESDTGEPEHIVEDFIAIRRLNQNTSIVFDSDKSKSHAKLTKTKQRLKTEFDIGPGFAWVTRGREVENYLDEAALQNAMREVHPSLDSFLGAGQWANLLVYKSKNEGKQRTADKVKVARSYVENNQPNFSSLDLHKRVNQLIEFIVKANAGEI